MQKSCSRNVAACNRRRKESHELRILGELLPLSSYDAEVLNQKSVVRLTTSYLKLRQIFPKGLGKEWGSVADEEDTNVSISLSRLSLQALDAFIFILGADGKIIYISDNASIILGARQLDLIGYNISDFLHLQDQEEIRTVLRCGEINSAQVNSFVDLEIPRKFCMRMKCFLPKKNVDYSSEVYKVIHCFGYLKLRAPLSEECADHPVDGLIAVGFPLSTPRDVVLKPSNNTFVLRFNMDLTISYSEFGFQVMTGYEPSFLVGKSFYNFVHPEHIMDLQMDHKTALKKSQAVTNYYRFLTHNGGWIWMQSLWFVIEEEEMTFISAINYVLSCRQCPELRLSEEQISSQKRNGQSAVPSSKSATTSGEDCFNNTPTILPDNTNHSISFIQPPNQLSDSETSHNSDHEIGCKKQTAMSRKRPKVAKNRLLQKKRFLADENSGNQSKEHDYLTQQQPPSATAIAEIGCESLRSSSSLYSISQEKFCSNLNDKNIQSVLSQLDLNIPYGTYDSVDFLKNTILPILIENSPPKSDRLYSCESKLNESITSTKIDINPISISDITIPINYPTNNSSLNSSVHVPEIDSSVFPTLNLNANSSENSIDNYSDITELQHGTTLFTDCARNSVPHLRNNFNANSGGNSMNINSSIAESLLENETFQYFDRERNSFAYLQSNFNAHSSVNSIGMNSDFETTQYFCSDEHPHGQNTLPIHTYSPTTAQSRNKHLEFRMKSIAASDPYYEQASVEKYTGVEYLLESSINGVEPGASIAPYTDSDELENSLPNNFTKIDSFTSEVYDEQSSVEKYTGVEYLPESSTNGVEPGASMAPYTDSDELENSLPNNFTTIEDSFTSKLFDNSMNYRTDGPERNGILSGVTPNTEYIPNSINFVQLPNDEPYPKNHLYSFLSNYSSDGIAMNSNSESVNSSSLSPSIDKSLFLNPPPFFIQMLRDFDSGNIQPTQDNVSSQPTQEKSGWLSSSLEPISISSAEANACEANGSSSIDDFRDIAGSFYSSDPESMNSSPFIGLKNESMNVFHFTPDERLEQDE